MGGVFTDLNGFYKSVFDALGLLNDFVKHEVFDRRGAGLRRWATSLREDLGARPCAWLRPDFVPPFSFLVPNDPVSHTSRILVEPHLVDAEFRKAWMPFFYRSGHPVVTVDQFLFVDSFPKKLSWIFSALRAKISWILLRLRSLLLVGWMVGPGMRLRLHFSLGSLGWLPF